MESETDTALTDGRYDFVIIGSGFGGSVCALRLCEKGYRVLVIEEGRRWSGADFPRTSWDLRKYLWLPSLGCTGIQRLDWLGDVLVLGGAGVGGGSLVYANTLLMPPEHAFEVGWPGGPGFRTTLEPFYATAKRMLGATPPPRMWAGEEHLRAFGESLGAGARFTQPEVGVLFGDEAGQAVSDPYFQGRGPARSTCQLCGGCMVGCRHDAKNSLDRNYLYLAERMGARIVPETRVVGIERDDGRGDGYLVRARPSIGRKRASERMVATRQVIVSAGALGTVDLLLACKQEGTLPNLSPTLGQHTRTNSEIIAAARSRKLTVDHAQGLAIASDLETSSDTHVQIVRYPVGSDMMGLLGTLAADGKSRVRRVLRWLLQCLRHPVDFVHNLWPFGWARRTVVVLVMQSLDNALTLVRKRRRWLGRSLRSRRADGVAAIPTYLPVANQAAAFVAERMGGFPLNAINEVLLDVPITAHILGGARMAESPELGVVDSACRVFGHPGLWIVDGSVIPVNLGANPSLTITAVAEYAMSLVSEKK